MENKDNLQKEQNVAQNQPVIEVESQVEGDVASFGQQPADVQPAPPVEVPVGDINKDVKEVSADEKKTIEEAQKKAQREYQVAFGDRQIRKPSKDISITIAVVAFILLAFFVGSKIPMFYNCMVPGNVDTIKNVFEETNIKDVEQGEDVWAVWYEYDEDTQEKDFNLLPGSTVSNPKTPSEKTFANLDEVAMDEAEKYVQVNWMLCTKETNSAVSEEIRYATIIWYSFEDAEDSKEYAELQKAKYADGQYEHKNALFYQLGMIKGTGDGFVYDAWYNGGKFVEVYASDAELAEKIRTEINYVA